MEKKTTIDGWLVGIRKLGKIIFLLVRQSERKIIQVVVKGSRRSELLNKDLKNGDFVKVKGFWRNKLQQKNENRKVKYLESQKVEIELTDFEIINKSLNLPFEIKNELSLKDDNRYKYRYLDLRREKSSGPIIFKSNLLTYIRSFLNSRKFVEIDTPILSQFSPEGARTFVVPSNFKNKFYTLPQSPQIFKQILMISGFSKYYQIAKNFRNEDLRSNRQPEFLQLDIETWMNEEKVAFNLVKSMMEKFLVNSMKIPKEKISFKKMSFDKCIEKYGNDKPDLRNPLEIKKFNKNFHTSKYLFLDKDTKLNNSETSEINNIWNKEKETAKIFIFKKNEKKIKIEPLKCSSCNETETNYYIKNFFSEEKRSGTYIFSELKKNRSNKEEKLKISKFLGKIRSIFDKNFEDKQSYQFLWINNWPLFRKEKNQNTVENSFSSFRHPFTMPKKNYINLIMKEKNLKLEKVKCEAYDLVCNGEEIASGSLRINQSALQKKVFELMGFKDKEIERYFGYFLEALSFAAPPHGGIGIGIERLVMTFLNLKSLKETIAFPKNIDGSCSLTGSPNFISKTFLSADNQDKN